MNTVSCIKLKIWRFAPELAEVGHFQDFEVVTAEALSIMALLGRVHEMDPSFACRTSTCFKGQCGSCLVRVNGRDALGCVTMVQPGEIVTLEPHSKYRVVRDLVVDFSQPQEG